jgi:type I restriction enzyme S subunit
MKRVQIRKVARLGTGHTPSRSVDAYWEPSDCTIPWLTLADVWQLRDGSISVIHDTKEKISPLGLANSAAVRHPAGTVAFSRTASVGFSCILGVDMATSQDFVTWTCGPKLAPRFLLWVLRGERDDILRRTQGSTHKTIYMPDIEQLTIPLPPLEAQGRIVGYLDRETARIDDVIDKKTRLAAMLRARVAAAVLADIAAMTDTTVALKRIARVIDCKHRTPTYVDAGYPVVSPGDVEPGPLDLSRCHRFVAEVDWADLTEGPRRPRIGDIIYSRNASVGIASLVTTPEPFCMGQDVCIVRSSRPDGDGRFLAYVLNTWGLEQIELTKIGSTFSRMNISQIADLQVPALEARKQDRLVAKWDALVAHSVSIETRLSTQIELLREHRRSLIAEAVAGNRAVAA